MREKAIEYKENYLDKAENNTLIVNSKINMKKIKKMNTSHRRHILNKVNKVRDNDFIKKFERNTMMYEFKE